jgi:chromosome segregation ATPase
LSAIAARVQAQIAKVGEASKQLQSETSAKADSLIQLMGLVQEQHALKHKELSLMHNNGVDKLQKIEAAIKEHDAEECDDVRAEVIMAKGKVEQTAMALKVCLETKKVIGGKIAAIEKARAAAQLKLDQCLATKAKLKSALHECHTRRDSARQKLEECLDRKKELKTKIDLCHTKRDEARKKLAGCLAAKKSLKAKIEAAKKKVGSLSSASLMEIIAQHKQEPGADDDVETLLSDVEGANDEFDEASEELTAAGEAENAAISEYQKTLEEEGAIVTEMKSTETTEAASEVEQANLEAELEDATQDLKQMDADSGAAASACQAAEAAVNQAGASLLAYQARIAKQ